MSQENVEIVRALHEAVATGGLDVVAAAAFLHRDFEMTQLPLHPEAGTYRGGRAAAESMQAWIGSFEAFEWEVTDFIDAGNQVVVGVREKGRGRGGEVALDHRYGTVYTVRDGKIVLLQWFNDMDEALEAVGLSEQDAHADS